MMEMRNVLRRFLALSLILTMCIMLLPQEQLEVYAATSGTLEGLADERIGLSFEGDAEDAWTAAGTAIEGSVKSTSGCSTTHYSSTLTITNQREVDAHIMFSYVSTPQSGTIQIDNSDVAQGTSTFDKVLRAGESVQIYIKSNSTSEQTKITLANIRLVAESTPTITFIPSENGEYTVNDVSITNEYSMTQSSLVGYHLVAKAADNYQFVGWYDLQSQRYLSIEDNVTLYIDSDSKIVAKFVSVECAIFETGNQSFENLTDAVNYAKKESQKKITVIRGNVISGDYVIPKGITLLVPFNKEKTLYTSEPMATANTGIVSNKSNEFCKLTLAEGSQLTVEGEISIGGRYKAASGGSSGYMTGDYGAIDLKDDSRIVVKNEGNLYAWGFITGTGTVTAESGANVYEWYQILDFRGGSATSNMKNKVFPFNQYSVQNIEVPLTLEKGANEIAYAAVFAVKKINAAPIKFIGNESMFKLEEGSITKQYDGSCDKLKYTINGKAQISNLKMNLAGVDVDSAKYVLPITNNMDINIANGSEMTIAQDIAILPGVQIDVAKNAKLNVGIKNQSNEQKDETNTQPTAVNMYIYDQDEWFEYGYACYTNFLSVGYAPGKIFNRTKDDLKDARLDINGELMTPNGCIYTTKGGASLISSEGTGKYSINTKAGTENVTYQYSQSGSSVTAHEIAITPARLQNSDETYTETKDFPAGSVVKHIGGRWALQVQIPKADLEEISFDQNQILELSSDTEGATIYYTLDGTMPSKNSNVYDPSKKIELAGSQGTSKAITVKAVAVKEGMADSEILDITYTITLPHEHLWSSEWATDGEYHWHECLNPYCGITDNADKNGYAEHVAVIDDPIDPTCTEAGKTEGSHCSVCEKILIGQQTISAKGHQSEILKGYSATCTESGLTDGEKCSKCQQILKVQAVIPAKGHVTAKTMAKAATCTEDGNTDYWTCSACGKFFADEQGKNEVTQKQWTIKATGHKLIETSAKAATCTETGNTTYWTCNVCGKYFADADGNSEIEKDSWIIAVKGHQLTETKANAATCTKAGNTAYWTCDACGKYFADADGNSEIEKDSWIVAAKGHQLTETKANAATCTKAGNTAYWTCNVCGKYFTDSDGKSETQKDEWIINAKGHTYENGKCKDCGASKPTIPSGGGGISTGTKEIVINQNTASEKTTVARPDPIVSNDNGQKKASVEITDSIGKQIIEKSQANKTETVVIRTNEEVAKSKDVAETEVTLSSDLLKQLAENLEADLIIETENGNLELSKDALQQLAKQAADGKIIFTLKKLSQEEQNSMKLPLAGENIATVEVKAAQADGSELDVNSDATKIILPVPSAFADKAMKVMYVNKDGYYAIAESEKIVKDGKTYFVLNASDASAYVLAEAGQADTIMDKQDKQLSKIKTGVKKTTIQLKITETKNHKLKVIWKKSKGYKMDSYQVYRSVKKGKFTKKPFFVAKGNKLSYINTKDLKKGKRYYYKVRGTRNVNGEIVYSEWSNVVSKAAR